MILKIFITLIIATTIDLRPLFCWLGVEQKKNPAELDHNVFLRIRCNPLTILSSLVFLIFINLMGFL